MVMRAPAPPVSDPKILLAQAHAAFLAKNLDTARKLLTRLLRSYPSAVPVLHLLALVEKQAGRAADSQRAFEAALRVAPRDFEILTNFGNLLAAGGAWDAAAARYQDALAAQPAHFEALIGLALARQETGQLVEARKSAAAATAARPHSARAWSVLGLIEKAAGDREAAMASLQRALAIDPCQARALHGRALIQQERGDEDAALATFARARAAAPADREITLGEAIARYEAGEPAVALAALGAAVQTSPDWIKGHRTLAQMRWQQGDTEGFAESFAVALRTRPRDPALWIARLAALGNAGVVQQALDLMPDARSALGPHPVLDLLEANLASAKGHDARADAAFERLGPSQDIDALVALARHRLRQGRVDAAAELATQVTARAPANQFGWALLGTAWRLNGDPRADWLYAQAGTIGTIDLDRTITDAAADRLRLRHRGVHAPLDQSLRGGTQTNGDLFALSFPEIVRLRDALAEAVREHVSKLPPPQAEHPLLGRTGRPFIAGSWSVRLTGAGFHVNHVHPEGWLSSACYIVLPPPVEHVPRAGWLKLGEPPEDLRTTLQPLAWIEPVPGRLALFPAYLWHGTTPFPDGERLTVAFDVVSARD